LALAKACTGLTLMKTLVLKASFTEHPHVGQRPMIQPQNRSRICLLKNEGNRPANIALRAVENRDRRVLVMKKIPASEHGSKRRAQELRPEYQFDYAKAQSNRFAGRAKGKSVVVLLAPDVARVSRTENP
jgi:hypothetical protein